MLKTILIDDEIAALESLEIDLKKHCSQDVMVVEKCQSPLLGLKAIKKHNPDLVFLDVMMPEMNGFELLEILGEISFNVVFVSAFDQYALQAFEKSAIHYLLKPVDKSSLLEAINRVKNLRPKVTSEQIQVLIDNMNQSSNNQKIAIQTKDGYRFIPIEKIMYCVADGGYTDLFLSENNNKIFSSKSLKTIQGNLPKEKFFRIHNSHTVNRDYIDKFLSGEPSAVIMQDGKSLNIARSKKQPFLKWMGLKDS